MDGRRELQRTHPPHVPQRTQRHHLHTTSTSHLRRMHSQTRLLQLRPRIPTSRHARSLGRNDLTPNSSRTKKTRNKTNTTHPQPNVERSKITTRRASCGYRAHDGRVRNWGEALLIWVSNRPRPPPRNNPAGVPWVSRSD